MGSRPYLHRVSLCADIDEGMGPRIREDTSGDGFPSYLHRVSLCADIDEGMGFCMREDTGGKTSPPS